MLREFVGKPVLEVIVYVAKRARGKDNINIHFAVTRLEFWIGLNCIRLCPISCWLSRSFCLYCYQRLNYLISIVCTLINGTNISLCWFLKYTFNSYADLHFRYHWLATISPALKLCWCYCRCCM